MRNLGQEMGCHIGFDFTSGVAVVFHSAGICVPGSFLWACDQRSHGQGYQCGTFRIPHIGPTFQPLQGGCLPKIACGSQGHILSLLGNIYVPNIYLKGKAPDSTPWAPTWRKWSGHFQVGEMCHQAAGWYTCFCLSRESSNICLQAMWNISHKRYPVGHCSPPEREKSTTGSDFGATGVLVVMGTGIHRFTVAYVTSIHWVLL